MKFTPTFKKMESAPAESNTNDIQKQLLPQSKEDILKLKNALSKNIDEDKIINNNNLICLNHILNN